MPVNFDEIAKKFMNSPEGAKLLSDPQKIAAILNSPQGKEIASMLNGSGGEKLKQAVAGGETSELRDMVSSMLKSTDGSKLADEISKQFSKKE